MPKSASASSVRPAPSSPMRPTTSPACRVKETSANSPARLACRTSSTGGRSAGGRAVTRCSMLSPVISSARRRSSISAAGKVPTLRPSRSTVTRSAISTTSSRRWLTKTTATPWAFSRRIAASRKPTSCRVSEAVGSSMNRMRALAARPRQIATIWRCATGSVPTGRRAADRRRAGRAPPAPPGASPRSGGGRSGAPSSRSIAMFSSTVRFGNSDRSWKMTCMPSDRARCGVRLA